MVRECLKALCHRIRPTPLRVAKQLDLSSVMMLQQRFQEKRHRMPPEIRGYIADLQPPFCGGVVGASHRQCCRPAVSLPPGEVRLVKLGVRALLIVVQTEQQIAASLSIDLLEP